MLIESKEKEFIEYLNEYLFARGINSAIFPLGPNAQGDQMYGIDVVSIDQQSQAFHLLYQDQQFLTDLGNMDHANRVFALRSKNLERTGGLLSSKPVRVVSIVTFFMLAIYFLI